VKPIQVAVGVIKNPCGQVLISLRHTNLHQGGLWEFPGGKIESHESAKQALVRELDEELGMTITDAMPLITVNHNYPDLAVQLRVLLVENYNGTVKSREGQAFCWVNPDDLINYAFPAANQPIITAAQLPSYYAILDDTVPGVLLNNLNKILNRGITLIQARLKNLSPAAAQVFLQDARNLCHKHNARLLLNSGIAEWQHVEGDGVHLTSIDLMATQQRPALAQWVVASCHNLAELQHAQQIGADFVVLAPVLPTPTHPEAKVLGWEQFTELTAQINLPVFALGGLTHADLSTAREAGAQGIAGIRAFWDC
jgi:8-oxo-dGTP diphosphatase